MNRLDSVSILYFYHFRQSVRYAALPSIGGKRCLNLFRAMRLISPLSPGGLTTSNVMVMALKASSAFADLRRTILDVTTRDIKILKGQKYKPSLPLAYGVATAFSWMIADTPLH